jgi:hypothetical protein
MDDEFSFKIRSDKENNGIAIDFMFDDENKNYTTYISAVNALRLCDEMESALNSINVFRCSGN